MALKHFKIHITSKDFLRSAKNVAFFLLRILVDKPMGNGGL